VRCSGVMGWPEEVVFIGLLGVITGPGIGNRGKETLLAEKLQS